MVVANVMARHALTAALVTLSLTGVAEAQSDYEDAQSLSVRLEREGRARDAASSLDPFLALHPQDHDLALRLGWLWFQAGDNALARRRYELALRLSGDTSHDARLGLAWTLLRLGDSTGARREFEQLVALDAADASAREGLTLTTTASPRPLRVWASLWAGAQLYTTHPQRTWSLSVAPSITVQLYDWPVFGVTYRAVGYALRQRPAVMGPPVSSTNLQQEIHLMAGVARTNWALRAHLGHVWDGSNAMTPATAFGVSGRLTLRGDLSAELSESIFQDYSVARAAVAWAAQLSDAWRLGPVASAQYDSGGAFGGSIGALVGWRRGGYEATLSARYGDERRPTSLVEGIFWASDDRIRGALSLSGLIPLGGGLSLALRYDGMLLAASGAARGMGAGAGGGAVNASAHFFTTAIIGAW